MPKHKLSMLVPGDMMCIAILLLVLSGFVLSLLQLRIISTVIFSAAGIIFLILLVLLVIEHRQDEKAYRSAKKEDPEIK